MSNASNNRGDKRLSDIQRILTLDGVEYLVRGSQDPFSPKSRIFRVWTPSDFNGDASTLMTIEGRRWGLVGTDAARSAYAHLPAFTQERLNAHQAAMAARVDLARKLIALAFPELRMAFGTQAMVADYEGASSDEPSSAPEVLPGEEKASEMERLHDGEQPR